MQCTLLSRWAPETLRTRAILYPLDKQADARISNEPQVGSPAQCLPAGRAQLPGAGGPSDALWLDVYSANALSRVGGLGTALGHMCLADSCLYVCVLVH